MADLTGILTTPASVVEARYAAQQEQRTRLGLSEVGHECDRYLWYRHHGYQTPPLPGRILRLYRLGEIIEAQVKADLRASGYAVYDEQREVFFDMDGIRLTGHIDGIILLPEISSKPHLLEIKSANDRSFKDLLKNGYEAWNEKYRAQVQVYMLGLELTRALVWVENKNTSEIHTERINLNKKYALDVLQRAFRVIQEPEAPQRACPKADYYKARFCGYSGICFKEAA